MKNELSRTNLLKKLNRFLMLSFFCFIMSHCFTIGDNMTGKATDLIIYDTSGADVNFNNSSIPRRLVNYSGYSFEQNFEINEIPVSLNHFKITNTDEIENKTDKFHLGFFLNSPLNLANKITANLVLKRRGTAINFSPRKQNIPLKITTTLNTCSARYHINAYSCNDDILNHRLFLYVQENIYSDFAGNYNNPELIPTKYIYAPSKNCGGTQQRNYIYTGINILQNSLYSFCEGENCQISDNEVLTGFDIQVLSAEPLQTSDMVCTVIEGTGINTTPRCTVTAVGSLSDIQEGTIHSCNSHGCEPTNCAGATGCRRNTENNGYIDIIAPFKYWNHIHIDNITGNTYYLTSGQYWTFKISLKNNCNISRGDGTNSTYIKLQFKKIISPYKAGREDSEEGIMYTSDNIGQAIEKGSGDVGFEFYISNPQTSRSGEYSGGVISKINYELNFSEPVSTDYTIEGNVVIGNENGGYSKTITIIKPLSRKENEDAYKFAFPTY